jgi:4-hydroxy-tetrahydrodipicolinate reductase
MATKKNKKSNEFKTKIKLGLIGSGGRMGHEISKAAKDSGAFDLFLGVSRSSTNKEFLHQLQTLQNENANNVDLWIDFSSPELFDDALATAVKFKKPFVSGTTGLSDKQFKNIDKAAKKIPILWASNMSLGVALLNEAIQLFSKISDFDFQIEEFHHNKKKDNPSGTAKTLQQTLEISVGKQLPPIMGIRGGGIFGIHKVYAMSDQETICFEHTALNRAVFAQGAVRAGLWLYKKKPGLYKMSEVLLKS